MKFSSATLRRMLTLLAVASVPFYARAQFIDATPEELKMTSQPEVPGAAAVYLNKEESTEDALHMFSVYARIKMLTEAGKKYADVELPFYSEMGGFSNNITDIQGRTVHADGAVVPFTGKPYEKLIVKSNKEKVAAKVFSLPDVQVGSIIEYRYKIRYPDDWYTSPHWIVQSDLFVRKAHYTWKPTSKELMASNGRISYGGIAWSSVLPTGVTVKKTEIPSGGLMAQPTRIFDLNVENVPPIPEESYMPPISNLSYRVYFYYAMYDNQEDYWKNMGKEWSKDQEKFINAGSLNPIVSQIVSPSDSQDQALHKIYAAMMNLENTGFTRERTGSENKAAGAKESLRTAADIWQLKRGSGDQIADLFVGLARAAHMKAYVMAVADRDRGVFIPEYLDISQFDDNVAVVVVDGKEQYFDPGQRYCPYGHLAWEHTYVRGIRQTEGGTSIAETTPGASYKDATIKRVADLTMEKDGAVSGIVTLAFTGSPALEWRQKALRTDDAGIHQDFKEALEEMLPGGMEVNVNGIQKLTDYESGLIVQYTIKGNIGSVTGKRIILPGDIFEVNSKAAFPHDQRTLPVYFHYAYTAEDVARIKFPAGYTVESAPAAGQDQYAGSGFNRLSVQATSNSVTVQRDIAMADVVVPQKEYPQLRAYYTKMEQKAQENIVLNTSGAGGGN